MIRLLLALCCCVLACPAAAEALLRPRVVVEGSMVTLGDLFDNVGDKGDIQVMRAPAPGQRVGVDGDWLRHVALINGLTWHPRGLFEEATIERSGIVIGREQILTQLQDALLQKGAPAEFIIETDNHQVQLVAPSGSLAQVLVRELYYNRQDQRFTATISLAQPGNDITRLMVSGKLLPTVQLPVLTRPIGRGDIIAAGDITMMKLRESEQRAAMVAEPAQMIGMTAKQSLRAGQPVMLTDLQKPLAVTRGALVTMALNHGGMALSAQGRAVDQGSIGDVIRVTNTHSNLTVEATIVGTNQVRVSLGGPVALAN